MGGVEGVWTWIVWKDILLITSHCIFVEELSQILRENYFDLNGKSLESERSSKVYKEVWIITFKGYLLL